MSDEPVVDTPVVDTDLVDELDSIFGTSDEKKDEPQAIAPEPVNDETPVAGTEDEKTVAEPATAIADAFDENLLAHAASFGIAPDVARRMGSPEQVAHQLWVLEGLYKNAATATRQQTPEQKDELKAVLEEIEKDPDGYDEKIVKAIKGLHAQNEQLNKAVSLQMQAEMRRRDEMARAEHDNETRTWDKLFNENEMADVFGKGNYGDSTITPAQLENRSRVVKQALLQENFLRSTGRPVPETRELLAKAVNIEFPDAARTNEQSTLAKQLSRRESQLSVRPRASKSATPKSVRENFSTIYEKVMGGKTAKDETVDSLF